MGQMGRALSEYREIRISGYDFDMSDIQISEYEGNKYENDLSDVRLESKRQFHWKFAIAEISLHEWEER